MMGRATRSRERDVAAHPSPHPPWPPSLTFKVRGAGKISHALPSRAGLFSWGCHTGGSEPRGLSRKSSRGRLLR